jgi:hypothetical protein
MSFMDNFSRGEYTHRHGKRCITPPSSFRGAGLDIGNNGASFIVSQGGHISNGSTGRRRIEVGVDTDVTTGQRGDFVVHPRERQHPAARHHAAVVDNADVIQPRPGSAPAPRAAPAVAPAPFALDIPGDYGARPIRQRRLLPGPVSSEIPVTPRGGKRAVTPAPGSALAAATRIGGEQVGQGPMGREGFCCVYATDPRDKASLLVGGMQMVPAAASGKHQVLDRAALEAAREEVAARREAAVEARRSYLAAAAERAHQHQPHAQGKRFIGGPGLQNGLPTQPFALNLPTPHYDVGKSVARMRAMRQAQAAAASGQPRWVS